MAAYETWFGGAGAAVPGVIARRVRLMHAIRELIAALPARSWDADGTRALPAAARAGATRDTTGLPDSVLARRLRARWM